MTPCLKLHSAPYPPHTMPAVFYTTNQLAVTTDPSGNTWNVSKYSSEVRLLLGAHDAYALLKQLSLHPYALGTREAYPVALPRVDHP